MRLKNLNLAYIILLYTFSCTDEPTLREYEVLVENQSSNEITIEGYDSNNTKIYQSIVQPKNRNEGCFASLESFDGLATCNTDSLVFKFSNGKGYICALRENGLEFCFSVKSPFESEDFNSLGHNTFEFIITQEDFENAFELPE